MTSAETVRWPEEETAAVADAVLRATAPREARSTRAVTFAAGLSAVPESAPEACRRPLMAAVVWEVPCICRLRMKLDKNRLVVANEGLGT